MNKQDVFNKVATHLLTQNSKSIAHGECKECMYRGENNTSCAIGCLIKDEYYRAEFEQMTADSSYIINTLIASGIEVESDGDEKFLMQLQVIHDKHIVENWKTTLITFASLNDLTLPEIFN